MDARALHLGLMPRRLNLAPDGIMARGAISRGGAILYVVGWAADPGKHCRDHRHGMPFAVLNTLDDKRELLAREGRQRRLRR